MKLFRNDLPSCLAALAVAVLSFCANTSWAGFGYQAEISVAGYSGGELTDFPLLVRVSPTRIKGFAYADCRPDGADIRFFLLGSSQALFHEIDTWNPSGESLFWVRVPSFTSSTVLVMKYGNVALSTPPDATNVWASAGGSYYGAVWHFNDTVVDGTENAVDAAKHLDTLCMDAVATTGASGNASERVACVGAVGTGRVNASSTAAGASANHQQGNYFLVPNYNALGFGTTFTISLWAKTDVTGAPGGLMCRKGAYYSAGGYGMSYGSATSLSMRFGGTSNKSFSGMPRLTDGWTHLTFVCDDLSFSVYTNGVLHSTATGAATAADNGTALSIGSMVNSKCFTGAFDEIRLLDGTASSDWIRAEHDAVASDGFLAYDAAIPFGNTVVVAGVPDDWGNPVPAYGIYTGYAGGRAIAFRASDEPFDVSDGLQARFAGWKYFEADADGVFTLRDEATTNAWNYTHVLNSTVKFAWQLKRLWKLTLVKSGEGDADFFINGAPASVGANWVEETNAVVVTVVPKGGAQFLVWDDSPTASATRTNELFAATTMTAYISGEDELTSGSYVRDGLVLQLDGIDNVRRALHDDAATTWVNLVGENSLVLPTGSAYTWTWETNAWKVTAANTTVVGGPKVEGLVLDWDNLTFESCADVKVDRASYFFWVDVPTGAAKFVHGANRGVSFTAPGRAAVEIATFQKGTHAASIKNGMARVWRAPDVETAGASPAAAGQTSGVPFYLYAANTYYNDRFVGSVYATRIYNRCLTDHELRWNAFVDEARFLDSSVAQSANTRIYVGALPNACAILPTERGVIEVAKGTPRTFSIASDLVTDALDGKRVSTKDFGTGIRARYLGYTLSEDRATPVTVAAAESVIVETSAYTATVAWNFDKEYLLTVSAGVGGTVAVDGGTAGAGMSVWLSAANARGVSITATAGEGYRFFSWKGDLEGISDPTSKTISIVTTQPYALQAVFIPTGEGHEPVEASWKSSVKTGAWEDSANWSTGEMPTVGDTVYLTNSAATTVTLEQPVDLAELVVGGKTTLKVSNWFSQIKATRVRILNGGTITTVGGFTESQMSNRVWLAGADLTIENGGKIDVSQCGYARQHGPCWELAYAAGMSPATSAGVSYGGKSDLPTYGSLEYPTDPGSGAEARFGGGAAFLDFTGTVTIDGTVNANGAAGNSGYAQPGSTGGAVLINCAKITGEGAVYAGASVYESRVSTHGVPTYCSGGGRIAVHYNPMAQDTVSCRIRFSAPGGMRSLPTTPSRSDPVTAGVGTLYFTDNRFLTGEDYRETGWRLTGVWHSGVPLPSPLELSGNRSLDLSRLEILQKNLDVRVAGDLTLVGTSYFGSIETGLVLGDGASLSVGGNLHVAGSRLELGVGGSVQVDGSLTQSTNAPAVLTGNSCKGVTWNGGVVVMHAAPTNGTETCGASVEVGGRWTVGTNAVIYPWCQVTNGAAVRLAARRFALDRGGRIDADERGFSVGMGPGIPQGTGSKVAASHGGLGSAVDVATSNLLCAVYGKATCPLEAGSGGNLVSGTGCPGGGVVWLEVARDAVLSGILSANSVTNRSLGGSCSGASGGSVYVRANKLFADGLNASAAGGTSNIAPGGGGRIAFAFTQLVTNDVVTSVRCGTKYVNKVFAENTLAEPGTVEWVEVPGPGLLFIVR